MKTTTSVIWAAALVGLLGLAACEEESIGKGTAGTDGDTDGDTDADSDADADTDADSDADADADSDSDTDTGPIEPDCSACAGQFGANPLAMRCAIDLCDDEVFITQDYSSPTGSTLEGTFDAVAHFGDVTNDLAPSTTTPTPWSRRATPSRRPTRAWTRAAAPSMTPSARETR